MHTHLIEAESHLRLIIKELTAERDALKRKVHQLERKLEPKKTKRECSVLHMAEQVK